VGKTISFWWELAWCFKATGVFPGGKSHDHRRFEEEVSFKAELYLEKGLFDSVKVLNLRKKYLISVNGRKKFKTILSCLFGKRRKVQVTKVAFEDFIFVVFCCERGRHIV